MSRKDCKNIVEDEEEDEKSNGNKSESPQNAGLEETIQNFIATFLPGSSDE